ncbi:MAG TPA: type II secretion system protein GspE, partial [Myxococcales bacterium]|nr:type II secretion system protein GspE [Myxococcales bacterium]
ECKEEMPAQPQALIDIGMAPEDAAQVKLFRGRGCRNCNDTGYRGRVALYEVMPLWDSIKELVINGASTAELKAEAIRLGMQTLRMAAIHKLKVGMTSIEEVVGNTAADTMR